MCQALCSPAWSTRVVIKGLASRRWSHCLNPTFTVSKPLSPASGPSMWNLRFTSDDATGCV
ncbi:unnamed protein product [Brassica rapa subsp. trilocularis]